MDKRLAPGVEHEPIPVARRDSIQRVVHDRVPVCREVNANLMATAGTKSDFKQRQTGTFVNAKPADKRDTFLPGRMDAHAARIVTIAAKSVSIQRRPPGENPFDNSEVPLVDTISCDQAVEQGLPFLGLGKQDDPGRIEIEPLKRLG